jgi:RNA polymerase-binding transcription factor DksA
MHQYRYLTIEQRETLESLARERFTSSVLDAALERLHRGDYGLCLKCGTDIAFIRLRDDLLAPHCRACAAEAKPRPTSRRRAGTPAPR